MATPKKTAKAEPKAADSSTFLSGQLSNPNNYIRSDDGWLMVEVGAGYFVAHKPKTESVAKANIARAKSGKSDAAKLDAPASSEAEQN